MTTGHGPGRQRDVLVGSSASTTSTGLGLLQLLQLPLKTTLCSSSGNRGFSSLRLSSVLFLLSIAALISYVALRKLLTFKRQKREKALGGALQMFGELDTDSSGTITRCADCDFSSLVIATSDASLCTCAATRCRPT